MKRLGLVFLLLFVLSSCGNKSAVKSDDNPAVTPQTNATQTTAEKTYSVYGDKLDNTAYSNVIQVFHSALTEEKASPTPKNIYATGEAAVLLVKFFKENLTVKRYGFTQDDIETYKGFAQKKFQDVLQNKVSSEELKTGAQAYLGRIANL